MKLYSRHIDILVEDDEGRTGLFGGTCVMIGPLGLLPASTITSYSHIAGVFSKIALEFSDRKREVTDWRLRVGYIDSEGIDSV